MTISINTENASDRIQNPLMITQKNRNRYGEPAQVINIYKIPTANIKLHGESLNASP